MKDKIYMILNDTIMFLFGALIVTYPLINLALAVVAIYLWQPILLVAVFWDFTTKSLITRSWDSLKQIKGAIVWKLFRR